MIVEYRPSIGEILWRLLFIVIYIKCKFNKKNIIVAQALLSKNDFSNRLGYLNIRNTLFSLINNKVIPIINENDVVSVDELQGQNFGDNDNLSAMVANLIDADLLIILSDIIRDCKREDLWI